MYPSHPSPPTPSRSHQQSQAPRDPTSSAVFHQSAPYSQVHSLQRQHPHQEPGNSGGSGPYEDIPMPPKYHPSSSSAHYDSSRSQHSSGFASSPPHSSVAYVPTSTRTQQVAHLLPPKSPKSVHRVPPQPQPYSPPMPSSSKQPRSHATASGLESGSNVSSWKYSTGGAIPVSIATSSYSDYDNLSGVLNPHGSTSSPPNEQATMFQQASSSSRRTVREEEVETEGTDEVEQSQQTHEEVQEDFQGEGEMGIPRDPTSTSPSTLDLQPPLDSPKAVRVTVVRSSSAVTGAVSGTALPTKTTHPHGHQAVPVPPPSYLPRVPLQESVDVASGDHRKYSLATSGLASPYTAAPQQQRVKSSSHPHLPPPSTVSGGTATDKPGFVYARPPLPPSQGQHHHPDISPTRRGFPGMAPGSVGGEEMKSYPPLPLSFTHQHQQSVLQWLMQENADLRQRLLEYEHHDSLELEMMAQKLQELQVGYERLTEVHERQCALENELSRRSQINDLLLQQQNESLRKFLSHVMREGGKSSVGGGGEPSGSVPTSSMAFVPNFAMSSGAGESVSPPRVAFQHQQASSSANPPSTSLAALGTGFSRRGPPPMQTPSSFEETMGYENLVNTAVTGEMATDTSPGHASSAFYSHNPPR